MKTLSFVWRFTLAMIGTVIALALFVTIILIPVGVLVMFVTYKPLVSYYKKSIQEE